MSRATLAALTVVALFAATTVLVPEAEADHCRTHIVVHSRPAAAPLAPPPYALSQWPCPRGIDATGHMLVPGAEQVLVQLYGDGGPSWPTLKLTLDGLGFSGHVFVMNRTANPVGHHYYTMGGYATIPGGAEAKGELVATVTSPHGDTWTVTYRTA